jgi:hypothetical protein
MVRIVCKNNNGIKLIGSLVVIKASNTEKDSQRGSFWVFYSNISIKKYPGLNF